MWIFAKVLELSFQNGVFLFQCLKQAAGFIEIRFYFLSNYFPLKERE
jgi:hypothetical protein